MATQSKKTPKLTVKQAKFVKAKAEGMTGVAAAQVAYGVTDYNTAAMMASENLRKPNIQEAVQAEMAKQGIDLQSVIAPITRALDARRVVQVEGDFFETEVHDIPTQLRGVQIAAQFMGINKQDQAPGTVNFINIATEQKEKYSL